VLPERPPEDSETPGTQSGPHWELQNGLCHITAASSVSAWCGGVAGGGGRVGGEFLGSVRGLWVVCSCGQFGFHGEAAHLPRNRGCSVKKRAIAPHRYHPVLLLPYGLDDRQCQALQRAHFTGDAVAACHFLWRLLHTTGKERQGHKRNGVQTA
jgi:hypothetical protein